MGVDGFFKMVAARAPDASRTIEDPSMFRGKVLGIDAPVFLHRARAASPHALSYLVYATEHLLWLRGLRCRAIFVFDGDADKEAKSEERERRQQRKVSVKRKLDECAEALQAAEDWDSILACRCKMEQHARAAASVGPEERAWLQSLLGFLGWDWCEAEGEGENYLAHLQREKQVDYVITEDSDALICGAPVIVRNFWSLMRSDSRMPAQLVSIDAILSALGMNEETLRTAAVLAGCDFAPKLRNVGIIKALKAARQCGAEFPECLRQLNFHERANSDDACAVYRRAAACLCARRPVSPVLPRRSGTFRLEDIPDDEWALRELLRAESRRPLALPIAPAEWTF